MSSYKGISLARRIPNLTCIVYNFNGYCIVLVLYCIVPILESIVLVLYSWQKCYIAQAWLLVLKLTRVQLVSKQNRIIQNGTIDKSSTTWKSFLIGAKIYRLANWICDKVKTETNEVVVMQHTNSIFPHLFKVETKREGEKNQAHGKI